MKSQGPTPIVVLVFLIVLGILSYFAYQNYAPKGTLLGPFVPTATPTTDPGLTPEKGPPVQDLKTYINTQNGFAFMYPTDFVYSTAASDFIPPFGLPNLITVVRKPGFQDPTAQYSEVADFSVSTATDVTGCYKLDGNTLTQTQTVNGTVFRTTKTSQGATGHAIDATVYRIVRGKICLEVETSIQSQTGSGEGLDSLQDVILADQQNLQAQLDQILSTFEFTAQ